MTVTALTRQRAPSVDRSADRLVAVASIICSIAFLAAALVSLVLPAALTHGLWLPAHLVLAGAATTAIVGIAPFFVAAFAAAPPAGGRLRAVSLAATVAGALGVATGMAAGASPWAVAGGCSFLVGLALTAVAIVAPIRRALGPSRGLVTQAYLFSLLCVATGATIATLFLAGWPPVAEAWSRLKPGHAWLNLVGFVSLVIATTLLHLFPTAAGARSASRRAGRVTILGLGAGALLVFAGYLSGIDLLARAGGAASIAGAIALAVEVASVWRRRFNWTTDPAWHTFTILGMGSAVAWFVVGIGIAGGRLIVLGSAPSSWSLELVVAPLVIGWVGLAVVASASHFLPSIGPGDPAAHTRQRSVLGTFALVRLAALDAGVAALALGSPLAVEPLRSVGLVLVAAGFATTAILLVRAVAIGLASRPKR